MMCAAPQSSAHEPPSTGAGWTGATPSVAAGTQPSRIGSAFAPPPPSIEVPGLALPKPGGAIRGIGEKFAANPATGTGSMSVPIATSPGRSDFGPQLSLTYDSGQGNDAFGFGWSLSTPAVTRRTDKGLPRYDSSDVFLLSDAEDLVAALAPTGPDGGWEPVGSVNPPHASGYRVDRYRPRTEGLFARIERWTRLADGDTHWRSVTRDNVANRYGLDANSRIADPADPTRVFSWLLCSSEDSLGNAISYEYLEENGDGVDLAQAHERHRTPQSRSANRYLERIRYGNRISRLVDPDPPDPGWMFEVVFDYGAHDDEVPIPTAARPLPCRSDPFSAYRAGFEVRTYRLCRRVLMFHHFPGEDGVGANCLVRSTDLGHAPVGPAGEFLVSVTQHGYRRVGDRYVKRSMPPVEFGYTAAGLTGDVHEVTPSSLANLPAGIGSAGHQWADLNGDGIAGVLVTAADAWYYKPNLGNGRLGDLQPVPGMPSPAVATPTRPRLLDLAGDGQLDVVTFAGPTAGYLSRTADGGWQPWQPFRALPTMDFDAPEVRMADLNGDGHTDLLVIEGETLTWYPSRATAGFGPGVTLPTGLDEESGPRLVFADGARSLHLADMSGDGLADLVRIGNGEVCYWPNLGHGRFGAKVAMDDAPWFDPDELFDQRNLRLTDVAGSGLVDIVYLSTSGVRVYFNCSGNGFTAPQVLPGLPPTDPSLAVDTVDLLGTGTTCLVWSSTHAADAGRSLRYADLMGGVKPYLLTRVVNNLGAETVVRYAASTRFHLADRDAGRPWLTRLPFPVQVVERVETYDRISGNRFVTRYAYHHGYFDGIDREFRGFGMTEQWDTEELSTLGDVELTGLSNVDPASHVPPVLTRTWSHTGAFLDIGGDLTAGYEAEYWREPGLSEVDRAPSLPLGHLLPETLLLADGSRLAYRPRTEELREAYRALKGATLRQEVYALDGSVEQDRPYQVSATSYAVELLQPMGGQPHAVCLTRPRETVTYHYERRLHDIEQSDGTVASLADPRVGHELTLDVDGYGNALRGVAVAYRRRYPDADIDSRLPSWAAEAVTGAQSATHVVVVANAFTNPVDDPSAYRTPLPAEMCTYELVNVPVSVPALLRPEELRALCDAAADGAHDLPYQDVDARGAVTDAPYRRLVEQVRSLYRRDDLTGALPLGQVESLALPYQNYRLALTTDLVASVYRRADDGGVTPLLADAATVLPDEGGYLAGEQHRAAGLFPGADPDGRWWAPSGRLYLSPSLADSPAAERSHAAEHYFLPGRFADPFGNTSTIRYDADDLLPVELTDPLGNRTSSGERDTDDRVVATGNDYRVLAPCMLSDANRNRVEVAFDALGMVAGTAVRGKPEERLGDSLDGFAADLDDETVAAYLAEPLAEPHLLLGAASSRVVYDLWAYQRSRELPQPQPVVAASLARETHDADLADGESTRIQHTFAYSDGFGREMQKKIQAEPGPLAPGGPVVDPRWVGSGWTIVNNKGNPVRQYEPFFSATHGFEFAVMVGVSPVLCYDPLGRVVATLQPNHCWSKVVFDAWRQESWDVNDTVLIADPGADVDIGSHLRRLSDVDYLPGWHSQRSGGAMGPYEQVAAQRAAEHAATPAAAYLDPVGRTFLTAAHNRLPGDAVDDPPVESFNVTRVVFDVEGNQRAVIDALGRVVMRYDYDLLGGPIHSSSMDAGQRWTLNDVTGKARYGWDSRAYRHRTSYDMLARPTEAYLRAGAAPETLVGRSSYGEGQPDAQAHNLRGEVFQVFDAAGVLTTAGYDFKGNPCSTARQLAADYTGTPDWSTPAPLEPETFTASTAFDALNRPVVMTAPDGSAIRPTYNKVNLLDAVEVNLRGETAAGELVWRHYVTGIDYTAKGQRERIGYGNGVVTSYEHDPLTQRLTRLVTLRGGDQLQDLEYFYDPTGNIIRITDAAQQSVFFRNTRVEPSAEYRYDAIYQLIEAVGREHLGQTDGRPAPPTAPSTVDSGHTGLDHPGDGNAMGRYIERYGYDPAGNILTMRHEGSDPAHPGWTRTYRYAEPSMTDLIEPSSTVPWTVSNRLSSTQVGTGPIEPYKYDAHGSMTTMPHLPVIRWNHLDRLEAAAQQVVTAGTPETTWYVYDVAGQRVRKVTERSAAEGQPPTRKSERIYLGGFEIYREYDSTGAGVSLERQSLHVMDDQQRVALVETRTQGDDGSPAQLIRYQLANHLGSASLELDENADIVSYEEFHPYGSTSYQAVDSSVRTAAKRYRFTGMERDEETGLAYHGARYYLPWLGRWATADPVGLADGTNVYAYVRGHPSISEDPTGRSEVPPEAIRVHTLSLVDELAVDLQSAEAGQSWTAPLPGTAQMLEIEREIGPSPISQELANGRLYMIQGDQMQINDQALLILQHEWNQQATALLDARDVDLISQVAVAFAEALSVLEKDAEGAPVGMPANFTVGINTLGLTQPTPAAQALAEATYQALYQMHTNPEVGPEQLSPSQLRRVVLGGYWTARVYIGTATESLVSNVITMDPQLSRQVSHNPGSGPYDFNGRPMRAAGAPERLELTTVRQAEGHMHRDEVDALVTYWVSQSFVNSFRTSALRTYMITRVPPTISFRLPPPARPTIRK
jgi:RHS repeat-associated protein